MGLDPFSAPDGKSPNPSPAPSPTSPSGDKSTKLRKAVSQSSEHQTQLQKQHTLFSSLKSHRKNQTAPAAISLNELKENKNNAKKRGEDTKLGTPTHDEKGEKAKDDKKDNQAGSPSIRRKFFDGLFHSFRPSKSRDTSPMGSKESLQKGRELKEGKELVDKSAKGSPASHLDLVTTNSVTTEHTVETQKSNVASKSPLMRTQSANIGTAVISPEKTSPGSISAGNTAIDGKAKGSPLHAMSSSSPSKDSGVSVRSKRASTGSLQKDSEVNGKDCSDSPSNQKKAGETGSPARSQIPHGREQAGSPFNRSSYTSVSSSEPDDGAFVSSK